mgnify:CR=1 FL=1
MVNDGGSGPTLCCVVVCAEASMPVLRRVASNEFPCVDRCAPVSLLPPCGVVVRCCFVLTLQRYIKSLRCPSTSGFCLLFYLRRALASYCQSSGCTVCKQSCCVYSPAMMLLMSSSDAATFICCCQLPRIMPRCCRSSIISMSLFQKPLIL